MYFEVYGVSPILGCLAARTVSFASKKRKEGKYVYVCTAAGQEAGRAK